MIVAWLKVIHIAAISLWAFGLMALPPLLMRRNRVAGEAQLHNLHRATRPHTPHCTGGQRARKCRRPAAAGPQC